MKLLLVHRYIRPDSPGYAHMLYVMGQHFAAAGHDVTIFSAQPSYNDEYRGPRFPMTQLVDGMKVIRTPLFKETKKNALMRALNAILFAVSLFFHAVVRVRPYDLMTVTTFPPTMMGAVARCVGLFRKTRFVYHCMDLYPEVAQTSGILKHACLAKLAARVDKRNCQKATAVVLLSHDMENTVRRRGVTGSHLHVINNFIIDDLDEDVEIPEPLKNAEHRFRVLFAGNIGRFQGLEVIIDAARQLANCKEIEFYFVGAGVMVSELQRQAGPLLNKTIFFHPYLPIQTAMGVIAQSHLGIVSLSSGVVDCAYPSKVMTYLECGCRLLTLVEPSSELSRFVKRENLGVVCQTSSATDVAETIRNEYQQWKTNGFDRGSIRKTGRQFFGQEHILGCWAKLLDELECGGKGSGERNA